MVFEALPPADVRRINGVAQMKIRKPKSILMKEGAQASSVMFIQSGRVRSFHITPLGRESTLIVSEQGAVLGLVALLTAEPIAISIEAIDTVGVIEFRTDVYSALLADIPRFALNNARILAHMYKTGIRRTRQTVEPAMVRLVRVLVRLCTATAGQEGHVLRFSHQAIATMADVSRCWATQKLNELQREGLVQLSRGRITVRAAADLEMAITEGLRSSAPDVVRQSTMARRLNAPRTEASSFPGTPPPRP